MSYWTGKTERAERAKRHATDVESRLAENVRSSVERSVVYGGPDRMPTEAVGRRTYPEIAVVDADSVSAVFAEAESGRRGIAVLNFASYKNPGGKFLDGSSAQEESLCHESTLYPILARFGGYYGWNKGTLNGSLYADRAIWTPDVLFERSGKRPADCAVITCAAPNLTAAARYGRATREENSRALASRISFVRRIAEENGVEDMILGAFGCGVFGQNPSEVATMFAETFYETTVGRIVYAIPAGPNLTAFERAFGRKATRL